MPVVVLRPTRSDRARLHLQLAEGITCVNTVKSTIYKTDRYVAA
jgi:hypothetical protein